MVRRACGAALSAASTASILVAFAVDLVAGAFYHVAQFLDWLASLVDPEVP